MLTLRQLALCQADAIARLARLRVVAQAELTSSGHLSLHLNAGTSQARQWVQDSLGAFSGNVVRVLRWEQSQAQTAD